MKPQNYLSIDEICSLLPSPLNKITKNRSYFVAEDGTKICIVSSRTYNDKGLWYGIYIDELTNDNINYVCLVAGFEGILLIPLSILAKYAEYADFKIYSNAKKRYFIRVKHDDNKILLFHSGYNDVDITKYFISSESDEKYIDLLNSTPIEKIYTDAVNFKDLEEQYKNDTSLRRVRHESRCQKERIAILENHTCQICGFHQSYTNIHGKKRWIIEVDHIIEKAKGGGEIIDNLMVLCPNCHAKKTFGVIKINPDFSVTENGEIIEITDHHLKRSKH